MKVNKMAYQKGKIGIKTKKNNKGKIRGETMCSTKKG